MSWTLLLQILILMVAGTVCTMAIVISVESRR